MDIRVSFPGGKRVDAHLPNHVVRTDQPPSFGGEDSAAAPFDLFLASLATCAGIYVLGFCQARKIPTEGIEIVQHHDFDADGHLTRVELELTLPATFPEKYRTAVANAASNCKVKKALAAPPEIAVKTVVAAGAAVEAALG
jgi:ribosomal protein S12 methylthiotransferase accessory factor